MIRNPLIFFLVAILSTLIPTLEKSINKTGSSIKEIPVEFYAPNEYYSDVDVASIDYKIICWQNQYFQKRCSSKGNKYRKNASGINGFSSKKTLLQKHNLQYCLTDLTSDIHRGNVPYYLCFRNLRI